ncbi:MAG: hypothetical protein IPP22_10870 [Nitrosomonas sp.]|nr:hypothetical protein [Nitrosomonas sp.]
MNLLPFLNYPLPSGVIEDSSLLFAQNYLLEYPLRVAGALCAKQVCSGCYFFAFLAAGQDVGFGVFVNALRATLNEPNPNPEYSCSAHMSRLEYLPLAQMILIFCCNYNSA